MPYRKLAKKAASTIWKNRNFIRQGYNYGKYFFHRRKGFSRRFLARKALISKRLGAKVNKLFRVGLTSNMFVTIIAS